MTTTSQGLKCGICDCDLQRFTIPQREQHYEVHFAEQAGSTERDDSTPQGNDQDLKCAFCERNLRQYTTHQRTQHYETHFTEQEDTTGPSPYVEPFMQEIVSNDQRKSKKWKSKLKDIFLPAETDRFWCLASENEPPRCYTPGLIPFIRHALLRAHSRGELQRAVLCYERAVHIGREPWDSSWGCGYRNFLMACIALMDQPFQPSYSTLLLSSGYPSTRNLQRLIEEAWGAGFDDIGATQLKKLVGTKKWIGTGDLWVAFVFRGIPAELVEFDLRNNTDGIKLLLDWIVNYFSPPSASSNDINGALNKASPVVTTDRMPLVLQYNGHSRTIVGYQINKKGQVRLLTFDPSCVVSSEIRKAAMQYFTSCTNFTDSKSTGQKRGASDNLSASSQKRMKTGTNGAESSASKDVKFKNILKAFSVGDRHLRSKKEYQILYFPMTNALTEAEREQRKIVTSTKLS